MQLGVGSNEDHANVENNGSSDDGADHRWLPVEDSDSPNDTFRDAAADVVPGRRHHQPAKKKPRGTEISVKFREFKDLQKLIKKSLVFYD